MTPQELLAARDARVDRRRELQRRLPGASPVGVTLVVPGPVKSSPHLEQVRDEAVAAVVDACSTRGWLLLEQATIDAPTGPEALLAVAATPRELKAALVAAEETHPCGRLWDLDVHAGDRPIGRAELGLAPRRCLVCEAPAHACARSAAHPLAELEIVVEELCGYRAG